MEKKNIVRKLGYLHLLHKFNMQQMSAKIGIFYGQQPIIDLLRRNGPMSQKQIAESLHMSAPNITAAVKRMLKAGLVEKKSDNGDMRVNLICVTERAVNLTEKFIEDLKGYDEDMFLGFSEDDLNKLDSFLLRMIINLGGDPDDECAFFRLRSKINDGKKMTLEEKDDKK